MTRDNSKARRDCVKAHAYSQVRGGRILIMMDCHVCRVPFEVAITRWIAEHVIPRWYVKDDTPAAVWPCCGPCDDVKTPKDISDIAKSKRVIEQHLGVKVSDTPVPGSKRSRLKQKMDGTLIDRRTGEVLREGRRR